MSSEESYRAILRYLTNEREPYAPGTEGNVKRKIRKAAACYVVRGGTLYYQRRQRHRKTFAELEVVLQPERRQGLIEAAHLGPGGTHHTRHQTWHDLSKTYWWRGERAGAPGTVRDGGRGGSARPACAPASAQVWGPGRALSPAACRRAGGRASVRLRGGRGTQPSRAERPGDAKAAALPLQEGGPGGWGRTLARGGASGASLGAGPGGGGRGAAWLGPPP